jgi:hypothetical protein
MVVFMSWERARPARRNVVGNALGFGDRIVPLQVAFDLIADPRSCALRMLRSSSDPARGTRAKQAEPFVAYDELLHLIRARLRYAT